MQTFNLKFTLLISALICYNLSYCQTNQKVFCPVPSTYFVGEYEIEDNVATVGPSNSSSNFESGTYLVIANENTRSFQIGLLPVFTLSDFSVELNLNCGIIQMNDIDINLSCNGIDTLIFASTNEAGSSIYDLNDDSSFIINYIEDPLGSCGGPFLSSFRMTKVCNAPENITFSNVTSSTIDMDWIDPNDSINTDISYTIEYGIQGFSLGNGQTINDISGSNYTIDNLQEDTMYDFYIWTECSDTNTSEILGPFSFGTFIDPVFEVDTNGVTCLCADANFGDSGTITINGEQKTFTKRSRIQLEALINNDINDPEIALTCTSGIQDMSYLFQNETSFNQDISNWDVSQVTTMSYMFYTDFSIDPPYSSFNVDIGSWDVSSVTDMSHMFENAKIFNQFIGEWDVSNVTDMSYLFSKAIDFNQPIDSWDVSSVNNMDSMFKMVSATSWFYNEFNVPLNNWDVSNVTNMSNMFEHCNDFNQSLDNWDVSNVSNMSYMFYSAVNFNQNIDVWNISNVTNMSDMFGLASNFNQPLNTWNVSNVINMEGMFEHCNSFNQPLDNWDVSQVIDMQYMFLGTDSFNHPLNSWNVSSVNHMGSMFLNTIYNQPLDNWDVSNVRYMQAMFAGGTLFNQPIGNWDVSHVELMDSMFAVSVFNQDISTWCVEIIPNEPQSFSFNSPLLDEFKPNWGETCTLSLPENEFESFKIYPNPVRDRIHIEVNIMFGDLKINILDIRGKIIYSQNLDTKMTIIDLDFLNSGVYIMKISNANDLQIERFIKE